MPTGGSAFVIVGALKIGASSGTAIDVSGVVQSFRLQADREILPIPPTLVATVRDNRVGFSNWTLQIVYYSNPDATSASLLTRQFLAALADTAAVPPGSLYYEGTFKAGVVSTSNPKWSGRFLVTGAGYGGQVGEVSMDSQTFPLTAAPTEAFS
jgi:hypothetical protein